MTPAGSTADQVAPLVATIRFLPLQHRGTIAAAGVQGVTTGSRNAVNQEEFVMSIRSIFLCTTLIVTVAGAASPAAALTMKECSAKYKAAQAAGTLNNMKWNDFRKAECGAGASAASPSAATAPA